MRVMFYGTCVLAFSGCGFMELCNFKCYENTHGLSIVRLIFNYCVDLIRIQI